MNKHINLLISTVRNLTLDLGTRHLSWLDQCILFLEANFIATELEHLKGAAGTGGCGGECQQWGMELEQGQPVVGVIKPISLRLFCTLRSQLQEGDLRFQVFFLVKEDLLLVPCPQMTEYCLTLHLELSVQYIHKNYKSGW